MQFTILGTTVSIVRKPREEGQLPDPAVRVRKSNELLAEARREALIVHAKAGRQNLF